MLSMWGKIAVAAFVFSLLIYSGSAHAAQVLMVETDNEALKVEIRIDKEDVMAGDRVTFTINFSDAATDMALEHVNYSFGVIDEDGELVTSALEQHTHDGFDLQSATFQSDGTFTVLVFVEGTGLSRPFDPTYSGTASSTLMVGEPMVEEVPTPEVMEEVIEVTYEEHVFEVPVEISTGMAEEMIEMIEVDRVYQHNNLVDGTACGGY